MLCQYGGLTQRAAAAWLGVGTGVAVSCQITQLTRLMEADEGLRRTVRRLEQRFEEQLCAPPS